MSIIRIKHNRENPYVMINRQSLWDKNLSLEAVGLFARLLSRPDDWDIRASELAKSCECDVRKIYRLINELISNGYCVRVQSKGENAKFKSVEYYVFESKKDEDEIQKMFPQCTFTQSVSSNSGKAYTTNTSSISTKEIDITNIDSCPRSETESETTDPIPSKEKKKDSFSLEDMRIAKLLWESIVARNPNHKPPKLEKWAGDIRLAVERDNRTYAELEEMIAWISRKSQFWSKNILSADKLRIQFDRIKLEMKPPETEDVVSKTNMNTAMKVRDILGRDCTIAVYRESVRNLQTGDSIPMNLPVETFETILLKWTGLRRKNG